VDRRGQGNSSGSSQGVHVGLGLGRIPACLLPYKDMMRQTWISCPWRPFLPYGYHSQPWHFAQQRGMTQHPLQTDDSSALPDRLLRVASVGPAGGGDQCQVPFLNRIPDDDEYAMSLVASSLRRKRTASTFERFYYLTAWFGPILALLFLPLRAENRYA
jgi:hypothetical protein